MPLEGEKLDELLSGFLDGELSDEELKLVETALETSPSAQRRLDELASTSYSLRSLSADLDTPGSSPKAEFVQRDLQSADLADRVIAEAKRQVANSGLPADHHVRLAAQNDAAQNEAAQPTVAPAQKAHWSKPTRVAASVVAIAAAVLLAIYLPTFWQPTADGPTPDGGFASTDGTNTNPETDIPETDLAPELTPDGDGMSSGNVQYVSQLNFQNQIVLIVDIELSEAARRGRELDRILAAHGILQEPPIIADGDIQKAVEETRMIVGAEEQAESSDALLYFIRADVRSLGMAMDEVYFNRADFPFVHFDLAIDNPNARLVEKIARSTGMRFELSQSFAAPVTVQLTGAEASPFSSVRKPTRYVSHAERETGMSGALLPSEDLSSILLIVR